MSLMITVTKRVFLGVTASVVMLFSPGIALADDPAPATDPSSSTTTTTTTPPAPTTSAGPAQPTGPQSPTGAAATSFHYNSATGQWENDYYIWDPVTHQTIPKNPPTYSYDPVTGKWSTTTWQYDPTSQTYKQVIVPTAPPAGETSGTPSADSNAGTPGSQADATTDLNGANAVAIANGLTSVASTGNAAVAYNTLGGNATSGNANILSSTVNMLQSSLNLGGAGLTSFTANIPDHTGDIVLDPSMLLALQPASRCCSTADTTLNVQNNGQITNNINLDASTGSAAVTANTQGGNATSGNANAVADVTNLANSSVAAAGGFLGVININGNLNGDILLPSGALSKALASNAPTMTLDLSKVDNPSLLANFTDTQNITNNVNTSATTGAATISNNTAAGNAKSGNASTNITVLNLTGHELLAQNSLLVFVNVLGKWVGLIVDAPSGATAAALSDGSGAMSLAGGNTTVNNVTNTAITNNVNINSASGDATVSDNTKGGNATSGNATASANILNLSNSDLSLSGWFGILFINVFGSWNGSFGVDTAAGNLPAPDTGSTAQTGANSQRGANNQSMKVFTISSTGDGTFHVGDVSNDQNSNAGAVAGTQNGTKGPGSPHTVLGAHTGSVVARNAAADLRFVGVGIILACCLVLMDRRRAAQRKAAAAA